VLRHGKYTLGQIQVIMPLWQSSIHIYKIKSNNSSEIKYGDVWLREIVKLVTLIMRMGIDYW